VCSLRRVKKGTATAGVQRQYTGTAGRVENAQVAVYLTYAGQGGHALIDRELYLPKSWASDLGRRRAAGIPDAVQFATKPALAQRMIGRALDADVPAGWVTGDEVYDADPVLRADLEARQVGYVLAVAKDHHVSTGAGKLRADAVAARLPARAWQRLPAGPGAKGHCWYDWAWLAMEPGRPGRHWLLIRRHPRTRELAYHLCYSPCQRSPGRLRAHRRAPVDHRRELPGRQGPGRPGRAPGPHLDRLATVGHPRHARLSLPHHRRDDRARPATRATGDDPAHPQRDRPAHSDGDLHAPAGNPAPDAMVSLAPAPPAPRPDMPLPAPGRPWPMNITIYGWSAKRVPVDLCASCLALA
jgi:DDE superfamily endonuclease